MAFTQTQVNDWFTANPGATEAQVAETVRGLGGLAANHGLAGMIGQHYGVDANQVRNAYTAENNSAFKNWVGDNAGANDVQIAQQMQTLGVTPTQAAKTMGWNPNETFSRYADATPFATMANQYAAGDYAGINSLLANNTYTGDQIANQFSLTQPQLDEIRNKGVNLGYTTPEIKGTVSNILQDDSLSPWKQVNKILETGQSKGVGLDQLQNIYGQEAVQPYLDTYKKGINDYLTETLATDPTQTTLNEVGEIHRAAKEFGLTPDEIAKYGGMDLKTAQSYFDSYDQGLTNLMTALNDSKYSETQKTAIALDAAQKYGTTDEEFAKASKGKYTEKDIAEYLDPVRNVPVNLQKLFEDENATAKDIQKFIADAKLDPRAAGIYGAALDKLTNNPELYLRVAASGKPDMAGSYDSFLKAAKATPELAAKYAPQIKAIEQVNSTINRAVYKDNGGVRSDWMYEMFMGLNPKETSAVPKQLDFTERKTDRATGVDEYGNAFDYERELSPATVKTAGVEPLYAVDEYNNYTITGYRKKVDSDVFKPDPYNALYATYNAKGNLTGYESNRTIATGDRTYYGAKWDADGSPKPYGVNKGRSGLGGFVDSIMSDPILGPLATIGAATFGGPAGVAALQAAQGASLEDIGKSMALAYIGGQVGGQVTNAVGGAEGALGAVGSQAAGQFAGNAATGILSGKDLDFGNMALSSLINAGVDIGGNKLLGESGIATLGSASPYAKAITSDLLSSAVSGKNPDLAKTITNTAVKEAIKSGKEQLKTAKAP